MRNKISKFLLAGTFIIAIVSFTYAQNQPKQQDMSQHPQKDMQNMKGCQTPCPMGYFGINDLTPDQKTKIDDLKLQHLKDVTPLKDQLKEKQARINTLLDGDKTDINTVNSAIDEFTGITNQLIKKKAEFRLAVRNVLTDKQKIVYDAKSDLFADKDCCKGDGMKGGKCGPGMHGEMHGNPNCPMHK